MQPTPALFFGVVGCSPCLRLHSPQLWTPPPSRPWAQTCLGALSSLELPFTLARLPIGCQVSLLAACHSSKAPFCHCWFLLLSFQCGLHACLGMPGHYQYNTWLLIKLMPKGVVFFLFPSACMHCLTTEGLFRALGIEGRKHGGESKLGGEAVTAHPRYDPDTGRVSLLACSMLAVYLIPF